MDIRAASQLTHLADSPEPAGLSAETASDDRAGPLGTAIRLRDIRHSFGTLEVLAGIDLEVPAGDIVGVVGPSGCGKSTLLELIAGLREPGAGSISVGAETAGQARLHSCAYMPQRDQLLPWLRALDNAALAPRLNGHSRRQAREIARPLFSRLGLSEFENAYPRQLSGGMRQRVAFARTLLSGKPVLLLDEPFASLDAITRADLQEWLAKTLDGEPRTVVLVSHDVEEALYLADRMIVLSPRPARTVADLEAPSPRVHPRTHAVSEQAFGEVREQALAALAGETDAGRREA